MNRKLFRIAIIICILAAILIPAGAVFAQEENLPVDPGITPDSPFYFLDKWGKGLGMFFAFGKEAKAQKALKYGEERLAEAEAMADKDRIREMDRAANDYKGYMEMVNERVENGGLSDNITERVCLATSKHLAVLERVRAKVSAKAGDAIANAENASMNGQINALRALGKNKVERAVGLTGDCLEQHLERARVRWSYNAASGNATSGNNTADTQFLLDITERIEALEDELLARAEELGIDATTILERLANSTSNRLDALSRVYENAPENARQGIENAIENSVKKYEKALAHLKGKNITENVPDEESVKNRIKAEIRERLHIQVRGADETSAENPAELRQNNGRGK